MKKMGAAGIMMPFLSHAGIPFANPNEPLEIHVFSKHLQFLDYKAAAEAAAEIGFNGMDLTVRPKGHVLPENVATDLPKAIQHIKDAGLTCRMITTAVSDAEDATDQQIIKTASDQGVKYYRSNWFRYDKEKPLEESLAFYQQKVSELSQLNKEHDIIGAYQNHSGLHIGASYWELKKIVETANPEYFGIQYDIRHAVAEGGNSWPNGVKLLRQNIKTIALKDFIWGKSDGKWKPINVPIGEGMVDFKSYFGLLKKYGIKPPVSMHYEYPLGGAEKGRYEIKVDKKVVFDAMKKDLMAIQKIWETA